MSYAVAVAVAAVGFILPARLMAEVKVDALIGDHMVVQRDRPLRLAGTAAPGEAVTATIAAAKATAKADAAGRWSMALPALPAGGPYTLKVRGTNTLTFSDVWAGEVWVASGPVQHGVPAATDQGRRGRRRARLLRPAPVHGREPAGRGARDEGGRRVAGCATPRTRPASRRRPSTSDASCTARWAFPSASCRRRWAARPPRRGRRARRCAPSRRWRRWSRRWIAR